MKHWFCRVLTFPRIWWRTSVLLLALAFTAGWGLALGADFLGLARAALHLSALCLVGAGTATVFSVSFAVATRRAGEHCRGETVRRKYAERRRRRDEQYEKCLGECIVEAGGGTPVWKLGDNR